jgi:beta-ribofuranosylaminobenzene 5'-phosphate synthase
MSARLVQVTTPSRLHFGMLSFGQTGVRQFGGVGIMISRPGIRLKITAADRLETGGPLAGRALDFARQTAAAMRMPQDAGCRIQIEFAPREHVGLGTGTQLGLAVAAGMHAFFSRPPVLPGDLARIVGRSERSSIGTHGFAVGGLLVEAGKLAAGEFSPLLARVELPAAWRFLVLTPKTATGLHGEEERRAFARLPAVPLEVTAELAREVLLNLLPSAVEADFETFSRSLFRFGHSAGSCFSSQQHGAFLDRRTAELVERLRVLGVAGVGQSSWGPTLFAALVDEAAGHDLLARLRAETSLDDYDGLIARPDNHGAQIEIDPFT